MCKHLQSSANIKRDDSETDSGRSLAYVMNSICPRIFPSGTPDVIESREDDTLSIDVS